VKRKDWLVLILGLLVSGAVLFGAANSSVSEDGFYVIPVANRNIITKDTNTAIGVNALTSNTSGTLNTASGAGALYLNTIGSNNTASGANALTANTSGNWNTAIGSYALSHNTTAGRNTAVGQGALTTQSFSNGDEPYSSFNTAVGFNALFSNQPTATYYNGKRNTALGADALYNNVTGGENTAIGVSALRGQVSGVCNTALGIEALRLSEYDASYNTGIGAYALQNCTGYGNIALGYAAGVLRTTDHFEGNYNIYIGHGTSADSRYESNTIRIGNNNVLGAEKTTRTFILGISGANIGSGAPVYVSSTGQLGTIASSHQYKENIEDMGEASTGLMMLRPVTFYYKPEYANGDHTLQYGLIAEEVAKVYPNLVQYDKTGKPQSVYYHLINAMLLNEVQKQQRQIQAEEQELQTLRDTVSKQAKELEALKEQQRLSDAQNLELLARLAQLESQVKKMATRSETGRAYTVQLSQLELQ
jgi:hypothetical protein